MVRWDRSRSGTPDDVAACMALAIVACATSSRFCAVASRRQALRGRIGFEDRLESPSRVLAALDRQRIGSSDLRAFVRLSVDWPTLAARGGRRVVGARRAARSVRTPRDSGAAGHRAAATARRQRPDNWVPVIQAVARHLARAGRRLSDRGGDDIARSARIRVSAQARGRADQGHRRRGGDCPGHGAAGGRGMAQRRLRGRHGAVRRLAPIAAPAGFGERPRRRPRGGDRRRPIRRPAGCRSASRSATSPAQSAARLLRAVVADLGKPDALGSTFAGSADALVPALVPRPALKDLLADELVVIDDATVSARD